MRNPIALLTCLGALLMASPATAAPRTFGLRATLIGQGVEAWAFPENEGPVLATVNRQQLSLPMIEALIPVGNGEILIGFTWHSANASYEFEDFEYSEGVESSAYALGLTAGYAHAILADEDSALRVGGRIGTGFGGSESRVEFDGDSESDTNDFEGSLLTVGLFLSGEYMFARHFGLQGELGFDYFSASSGDDEAESFGWLGTYTALSAVVRF